MEVAPPCCSQTLVHAQRALQLLHQPLVEGDLLPEVVLHHDLEVHFPLLVEVAHLGLQGEAHRAAAPPDAVRLLLVHAALVAHPLALLHLGEGTWWHDGKPKEQVSKLVAAPHTNEESVAMLG